MKFAEEFKTLEICRVITKTVAKIWRVFRPDRLDEPDAKAKTTGMGGRHRDDGRHMECHVNPTVDNVAALEDVNGDTITKDR